MVDHAHGWQGIESGRGPGTLRGGLSNLDLVRSILEAWGRGDIETVLREHFESGARVDLSENVFNPAVYEGYEEIARHRREVADVWAIFEIEVERFFEGEHAVVAFTHEHGHGEVSGVEVDRHTAALFRLRDGKHLDRDRALADLGQWLQRIRATLFHHGVEGTPERLRTSSGRDFLAQLELPVDARERIEIALAMIDSLERQLHPLEAELRKLARRQSGCRALMELYGMGELTSLVTLTELGDVQRLSASRKAVRMAGIDIGVHRSDRRSRVGKLNRQGSPHLRWALYEAALSACRPSSPDRQDYLALKARGLSHTRASLTIARKLARRSFHILNALGPAALDPVTTG